MRDGLCEQLWHPPGLGEGLLAELGFAEATTEARGQRQTASAWGSPLCCHGSLGSLVHFGPCCQGGPRPRDLPIDPGKPPLMMRPHALAGHVSEGTARRAAPAKGVSLALAPGPVPEARSAGVWQGCRQAGRRGGLR